MSILIFILSFSLENAFSLIFPKTSIFIGLFCLMTIFVTYPLYKEDKKYLISSFIFGLIYDVAFTDMIFLNAFIFLIIAYLIMKIYKIFHLNIFNTLVIALASICLYRLLSYLTVVTIYNLKFDYILLLKSIYSSLIVSVLYLFIVRIFINKLTKKKKYKY